MSKEEQIKQLKKQSMIEDIKALFNQIDDVKLYIIRPAIEKITKTYFSRAKALFVYYVGVYALALYDVYKMEQKQQEDKRIIKVLNNAEKDVNQFIAKYKLNEIDMLEIEDLPF